MQKKIENRSIQCCLMLVGVLVEWLLSFFDHPSRAIRKSWKCGCFLVASLFSRIATTLQREAKNSKQGLQKECHKHTSKSQIAVRFGLQRVKKSMKNSDAKNARKSVNSVLFDVSKSTQKAEKTTNKKQNKSRYQCCLERGDPIRRGSGKGSRRGVGER